MASQVLTNAFVSFAGNDISAFVRSVSLSYEAETQDDTVMGDDTRSNIGGLKNWAAEVEFIQDFAASQLDSILFPLVGTTGTLIIRADAGAVSTSNPNYTGSALLTNYPPLGNTIGDVAAASASFVPGGSSHTLARATS